MAPSSMQPSGMEASPAAIRDHPARPRRKLTARTALDPMSMPTVGGRNSEPNTMTAGCTARVMPWSFEPPMAHEGSVFQQICDADSADFQRLWLSLTEL